MAQIKYIKDLYENEEVSLREISRRTGHSFETVRKYAYQENWSEDSLPDIEAESHPVLGEYIPTITGIILLSQGMILPGFFAVPTYCYFKDGDVVSIDRAPAGLQNSCIRA